WTAAALNSAVYDCFGTLNIPVSFLSVEFIHDQMEGEISGEAQSEMATITHIAPKIICIVHAECQQPRH
ncbi:hypothetical protein KTE64_18370, partial [Burkholderia multivorans]|uniref:hypothetical protein n=1 Tax=Burkholderia multivorans TaxID=87883 RepID=UPI001C21C576